jgi:hypothetical protein
MKEAENLNNPEKQALNIANGSCIFNVGDSVLYHRDHPFISAYVVEVKDNGFGLWIRSAKEINGMFVDKFVSCYEVVKNCD